MPTPHTTLQELANKLCPNAIPLLRHPLLQRITAYQGTSRKPSPNTFSDTNPPPTLQQPTDPQNPPRLQQPIDSPNSLQQPPMPGNTTTGTAKPPNPRRPYQGYENPRPCNTCHEPTKPKPQSIPVSTYKTKNLTLLILNRPPS